MSITTTCATCEGRPLIDDVVFYGTVVLCPEHKAVMVETMRKPRDSESGG